MVLRGRIVPQPAPPAAERRRFFHDVLARAVKPLADYLERRSEQLSPPALLRPPGAIGEPAFLATCLRCGACAEACPADAIFALGRLAGAAAGTPVIDPDRAPCVVCDGLHCMRVCSSGALQALTEPFQIRMGLAEVYAPLCVRSEGEPCTLCAERCPMGTAALRINDLGPPEVVAAGCVGCGVCQNVCPTSPKAIVVKPAARG